MPVNSSYNNKPHHDPHRADHLAVHDSFMKYASSVQDTIEQARRTAVLVALITGQGLEPSSFSHEVPYIMEDIFQPFFTVDGKPELIDMSREENWENNPIEFGETPYVLYLTARLDGNLAFSHRYFACPAGGGGLDAAMGGQHWVEPEESQDKWEEASKLHWWAAGKPTFDMTAEKWDFKCPTHSVFYRLNLRPNLSLRK
ncbi:hypothetical protein B0O99DRAFT_589949 [Bisporella sp. PMI_857]|nr:hypothetical protein B0O99DRAFT_590936 [Bisporella sp. PMI_857]KAH8600266.1 hypothetical protein B0O99DRAFT_589949 [Bisporella sp. PMI_857]